MNYKMLIDENSLNNKSLINNIKKVEVIENSKTFNIEKKTYSKYQELKKINNDIYIKEVVDLGLSLVLNKDLDESILVNYGFIKENNKIRYVGVRTSKIIIEKKLTLKKYNALYNKSGMLLINKESGLTSFDICDKVGKIFDTKKVGHTGTLDPLADGLLCVLVNDYTSLSSLIIVSDKEYIVTVRKGISTDTYDITGKVLKKEKPKIIDNLEEVLNNFKKKYMQEVPIYSAVKVNGKKLYDYARNNQKVTLPKKEITIKDIKLLEEDNETFKFSVLVSKGTYIRSLINDISKEIDYPLTMEKLTRVKEDKFNLKDSTSIDDLTIENAKLLKLEDIFNYEVIDIDSNYLYKLVNGIKIKDNSLKDKKLIRYNNKVIGIIENKEGYINKLFLKI